MTFYLSGAGAYCIFLLYQMFNDQECSKLDRTSWLVIAIASIFWPLVIPLSVREKRAKAEARAKLAAMPKPLNFGAEARHIKIVKQVEEPETRSTPQLNPAINS
jgi:hypothetical protein